MTNLGRTEKSIEDVRKENLKSFLLFALCYQSTLLATVTPFLEGEIYAANLRKISKEQVEDIHSRAEQSDSSEEEAESSLRRE